MQKLMLLLVTIAGAMSAQDFHGIAIVAGPTDAESGAVLPILVNHSAKGIFGFAVQKITTAGVNAIEATMGFGWIAAADPVPAEGKRAIPSAFLVNGEGKLVEQKILAVLFEDMTFYGPENIFQDFTNRVYDVRSMARDVQYSADKLSALTQHRDTSFGHRSDMATMLLWLRDRDGDHGMEAAVARVAALPDVRKGE